MGLGSNTSNDFDMNTPESPQDVAMSFALDSHLNVNAPVPQYVQDSSSSTPTHSYDTSSLPDYKEPDYDYVAGFGFRRTPSPGSGSNHLAPSPTQRRTWEVNTDVRMQILSDRHDRIESRQSGSEAMQESLDDRMDMISERQDVDSMRISSIRKDLEEIQDALRNGFRGTWTSDHPAFCRPERAGRPTGLAKKARAHPLRGAKGSSVKCKHSRDNENEDEGDALPCPKRRKPSPSAGTRPVVPPPGDHFSDSDTEMMEIDNVSVIECATVYAMAKNARPTTKGEKAASKAPAPGSAPAPSQNNPRLPRHTHPRYGLRNLNQMQADRERREAAKQAADAARRQEAAAKEERGGAAAARGAQCGGEGEESGKQGCEEGEWWISVFPVQQQQQGDEQQSQQQTQGQNQGQDDGQQQDDSQQQGDGQQQEIGQQDDGRQNDGQQDDQQQDGVLQNQQQQDPDQEDEEDSEQQDERQEQPDEDDQQDNRTQQAGEAQEQKDEVPQQGEGSNMSDDSRAGEEGGQGGQNGPKQDKSRGRKG
uniref:Uncharacterized protein n=1 Tax=Colletotrichum fructicola (strain Nara gc5) TaxID=1213859 RepID=L2FGH1_COLFN